MRKFTGAVKFQLTDEYQRGRRVVRLIEDILYENGEFTYVIKKGAKTDWNSVPRFLWSLFPVFDQSALAALLHDDLLNRRDEHGLSRAAIDRHYRESMRALGVSQWRRNVMWLGVRLNALSTGDK